MLIWSCDLAVERVRQYGVVKVHAVSFGQSAAAAARRRGEQQPAVRCAGLSVRFGARQAL